MDALVLREDGRGCYAEVLVGGAVHSAQDVVAGGPDDMPVDQVAGTVKDCGDIASQEMTALQDGVDGLQRVGGFEL